MTGRDVGASEGDPTPIQVSRDRCAVILVTASWCVPCAPAPTVLRELDRRWDGMRHAVVLDSPSGEDLDRLGVTDLPTWIMAQPFDGPAAARTGGASQNAVDADPAHASGSPGTAGDVPGRTFLLDLHGSGTQGQPIILPGAWRITDAISGALAKHDVDSRFGPGN